MATRMDTEDRMERGLCALEGVVDLLCGNTDETGVRNGNLAALLDLVHGELRAALPGALSTRMGDND